MFKYRLERILDLREQELDKVKTKFQEAIGYVNQIQNKITQNKLDQTSTQKDMVTEKGLRSPQLYLNRLKHLKNQLEDLEQDLEKAKSELELVREELVQAQQKAEVLRKHKDKKKDEFEKAEQKKEENEMNELALIMKRHKEEQEKDD
ncbi:MAG: flagellar FliJ family protein [Candidatus Caenarcaniphilales bacterium]|nr:flagellar FliJ family protein [Candidatus Caenarcaniphilales bacterium]